MEILLEHLARGFIHMLMISMPCVLTAAGIGLVVGILQAVTQVQEQTIAAAPKILGVFLLIMIMGNVFMTILTNYFFESANLAFNIIPQQGQFVLPRDYTAPKNTMMKEEKMYGNIDKPEVDEIMKNPGKVPYAQQKEKVKLLESDGRRNANPDYLESRRLNGN